ncbi:hypothetical protein THAOC_14524 [Thalassiosira oceanica]|uniref:B30.2/SPRY domain-containing protein n=1 Tax=Thalassiosira oceanica TaxID=159749 RepID=K0SHE0_THAOC|nr:hypothetical protein THAOC_14524 [Thalassiosira oceanica]|eukprot:EJK64715.1 hypothetical protein THAOC_14524 [Thalassiosira oceanica]
MSSPETDNCPACRKLDHLRSAPHSGFGHAMHATKKQGWISSAEAPALTRTRTHNTGTNPIVLIQSRLERSKDTSAGDDADDAAPRQQTGPLGRTSARFGIPQAGQQRSLANESAQQRFRESAADEERSRLPKYDDESDVGLLRELDQPVSLTEAEWEGWVNPLSVSSSFRPEVAGKLRSQRTNKWGESNVHCCVYDCYIGRCIWTDWNIAYFSSDWQGQEGLPGSGTIGMLLDLDEGTLSVFKNGRSLGVMKEGLGGEYCWFVTADIPCTISISRGQAPN